MDRYKLRSNGKRTRLCKGKNDTCTKEPKKEGLCKGCTTGRDKTQFLNREDGEIFILDGIKYKYIGGQSRKLCTTDNCESLANSKGLCVGHANNSKRLKNKEEYREKIVEINGKRYTYNGIQMAQICNYIDNKGIMCDQIRVKDGKCKRHSPHWHCKFTGYNCTNIRNFGNYCQSHKNNVDNPREKSAGETKVAKYLIKEDIDYKLNYVIRHKEKNYYIDFYMPYLNLAIEYDGQQHFKSVSMWGGALGLSERIYADILKDKMCADRGIRLLMKFYTNL
jgi:hypothetical protein